MKLVSFGSYTFPVAEVEDRFGTRDAPDTFFDTTFGPVDALYEDDLDFGDDIVTRSFDIVAATPSDLQTALDAARACRGVYARLEAEAYDSSERWAMARCMNVSIQRTNKNFNWQRVTMRFRLPSAIWNGEEQDVTDDVTDGGTLTLDNLGNAYVDDLILHIIVAGSSISNLEISKDITEDPLPPDVFRVQYGGVGIGAGDTLMLDSGRWLVTKDGIADWGNVSFADPHAVNGLFRLRPGENTLKFSWDGSGTVEVRYVFNDKWR